MDSIRVVLNHRADTFILKALILKAFIYLAQGCLQVGRVDIGIQTKNLSAQPCQNAALDFNCRQVVFVFSGRYKPA